MINYITDHVTDQVISLAAAEHPHDLPFSTGDQLTILEPCNVIFWYLAEDSQGRRGVIPINFVQVVRGEGVREGVGE